MGSSPAEKGFTPEEKGTSLPWVGRAMWGERPQPARHTASFTVKSVLLGWHRGLRRVGGRALEASCSDMAFDTRRGFLHPPHLCHIRRVKAPGLE